MSDEIDGEDLNPILDAIDAAEEIPDPLDGLVEKSAEDPGAAFTPEVLERLVALKAEDRAAFEALRAKLKKAGCRVTALDEAMAEESGDGGRGPTQADILIDLAGAADLFHSADGTAFADIDDQRTSRNLAGAHEGLPSLAGAAVLRADRRRAEFRGAAIGAQRDRGEGAFRRTGTARIHPRRRSRRTALSRSRRRGLAGGGDRRHRLAGDRQAAGSLPPRCRHAALGRPDAGRIGRDVALPF